MDPDIRVISGLQCILAGSSLGQPKVNKVKHFPPFSKLMKHPRTKFHADTISGSKVIRSKKVKFIIRPNLSLGQNFLQHIFFLFIDILLKLQQQILMCFFKFS